ncbi:sigma 54-interacting transcriptional regulator [Flavobacterium sp.]|uniref:sigma 54-interacting transcriptional regulator n=1 Tax=Flavobacterium sp. TaxID=239 RepID=UPI00262F6F78|nr:sigma 54-interacting transcriptional regulator [Flavobacterium sp.]
MKNIYITWHYTNYGVAYLKHILSQFYLDDKIPNPIHYENLNQEALNETFNQTATQGFVFDEIIYLTAPQKTYDSLSSRRFTHKKNILDDDTIKNLGLSEIYDSILENEDVCYKIEKELDFVAVNFPDQLLAFQSNLWRNINHYSIDEQIKWLNDYSNFKTIYPNKLKVIELSVDDLRNEKQISDALSNWIVGYFDKNKNVQPIINVSLGSSETQVVWHILSESFQLPDKARFIKTYDDKNDFLDKRFKRFSIKEIPTNLISDIGSNFKIYKDPKSKSRELVNLKIKTFINSGFSILLLGERGIGKSQIANESVEKHKKENFKQANCASFDEDSKAEAELFGYTKGAFTGATSDKNGLLEEANGGVLFLDEIHHLSKIVQAKLMKALQTDRDNNMSIRRLGSTDEIKISCRLIFATNRTIAELKKDLLPDFYDRIVQHVITIPALRETAEDRIEDWKRIWNHLKFKGHPEAPSDTNLNKWLRQLPLYGNYRDLQKIAMYYNAFQSFDDATKVLLEEKTAFDYAKNEFEKYHSPEVDVNKPKYFDENLTTKDMIANFKFDLQVWAIDKFKGRKKAILHFKNLGDTITEKTLDNWKNRN